MQLSRSSLLEIRLATHGRAIHPGTTRTRANAGPCPLLVEADIRSLIPSGHCGCGAASASPPFRDAIQIGRGLRQCLYSAAPARLSSNWTLRLQSQSAVLPALWNDRRQHAPTRFSSAPQCLLQRRRERLVGCNQSLAFGGRINGDDRWAGLAVVIIPQNASPAHLVSASRVVAVVVRCRWSSATINQ